MAVTNIPAGDAKAIKRFSAALAYEQSREAYFDQRFMGVGETAQTPIQMLEDLKSDAGDQVTYDLVMNLKSLPTEGDGVLKNNEESLQFYTDSLYIDQMRVGVNCGGAMSRKRTKIDIMKVALTRQKEWWARIKDELMFLYLSGARGTDTDWILPTTYTGFAGNALTAPDTNHIVYAGAATSKATVATTDKMSLTTVDKLIAKAKTMGGGTSGVPAMVPCKVDGESRFILLMHPFQEYDVRTSTSTGQWLDIQKAAATAIGKESPLFKGGLGMYNNAILHAHRSVVGFTDYGAGSNVVARRALFMGRQAAVLAYGSPGTNMPFNWGEETDDRGNQKVIFSACIKGIKKVTYNSIDFGVIAVDSAAAQPF